MGIWTTYGEKKGVSLLRTTFPKKKRPFLGGVIYDDHTPIYKLVRGERCSEPRGKRKKTPVGMLKTNSSQEFQHNMYNATMPFLSDWRVPSDPTSTSLGTWWFRADKFCFFGAVARSFHMSEVLSMTKDSIVNEGQFTQSSSTSSTLAVKNDQNMIHSPQVIGFQVPVLKDDNAKVLVAIVQSFASRVGGFDGMYKAKLVSW